MVSWQPGCQAARILRSLLAQIAPERHEGQRPRPMDGAPVGLVGPPKLPHPRRIHDAAACERFDRRLGIVTKGTGHPAADRQRESGLWTNKDVPGQKVFHRLTEKMLWLRARRRLHRARQSRHPFTHSLAQKRNPQFQRMSHAEAVGIAKQRVCHVEETLRLGDHAEGVAMRVAERLVGG